MFTSFSMSSIFKKFLFFYLSTLLIVMLAMFSVCTLYVNYLSGVVKDLSRNSVMINDTFSLRQSIAPLVKDDVLEIQIINSEGQQLFSHSQKSNLFFEYNKKYRIFENDKLLYLISIKVKLEKFIFILLSLTLILLLSYSPFKRHEVREFENQSNEILASLSKKLAHDIRTPLSTLNIIASKISDQNIKELQQAVVAQINLISENLLNTNKIHQASFQIAHQSYTELLMQIYSEFDMKMNKDEKIISFNIDKQLDRYLCKHSNLLYSIICNSINNSFEAINVGTGQISVSAYLDINSVKVVIKDNGKGIPTEILAKLGKYPLSYGKSHHSQSGNGIALFNAKKDIENIKGFLKIESVVNQFTKVSIQVPL